MAVKEKEGTARPADAPGDQLRQSLQHLAEAVMRRMTDKVGDTVGQLTDLADGKGGAVGSAVAEGAKKLAGGEPVGSVLVDGAKNLAGDGEGATGSALAEGAKKLAGGESPGSAAMSAAKAGATGKLKDVTGRVKEALTGKGGKDGGKSLKVTNIVEAIDVGVPIDLAYDQWTRFTDFPSFMKKVEHVEQIEDEKLSWKAQVFWSHRTWESTIKDQVPNERIIWSSKGEKGRVDGAVTFHELAPELTRIIVVLEYHPQGLFERTGNLWRAQGRRVRLEMKHFQRHVTTRALLNPDEVEGWRGEIHDGEVVPEEEREDEEPGEGREPEEAEQGEQDDEDRGDEQDEGAEEEDEDENEDDDYRDDEEEEENEDDEDDEPDEEEHTRSARR